MIGSITGQISQTGSDWVLVLTNGGVGYKVYVTGTTMAAAAKTEEVTLVTSLIVREDQLTLYGFMNDAESVFFNQLVGISGVGPRMALGILNAGKVSDIQSAIKGGNLAVLTMISGIGAKTAERIMVELRNKIEPSMDGQLPSDTEDVLVALSSLGYNSYEVRKILSSIPADLATTEDRVKYALKLLSK